MSLWFFLQRKRSRFGRLFVKSLEVFGRQVLFDAFCPAKGRGCGWVATSVDGAFLVSQFVHDVAGPVQLADGLGVEGDEVAQSRGCSVTIMQTFTNILEGVEGYLAKSLFLFDVGGQDEPVAGRARPRCWLHRPHLRRFRPRVLE